MGNKLKGYEELKSEASELVLYTNASSELISEIGDLNIALFELTSSSVYEEISKSSFFSNYRDKALLGDNLQDLNMEIIKYLGLDERISSLAVELVSKAHGLMYCNGADANIIRNARNALQSVAGEALQWLVIHKDLFLQGDVDQSMDLYKRIITLFLNRATSYDMYAYSMSHEGLNNISNELRGSWPVPIIDIIKVLKILSSIKD